MTALSAGDQAEDVESVYHGFSAGLIRMGASAGVYTPNVGPSAASSTAILDPFNPYLYPPMQDSPIWPGSLMNNQYTISKALPVDWLNGARFGSSHSGGFNMAFCDGSVHAIVYEINATVHAMLSDRQDGNTLDTSLYLGP